MCLAVIALDAHPRYAVVVAANRDEFHAREAARAQWWRDDAAAPLLAGRDLTQGGTWLGVNRRARWAFVTNVREPGRHDPRAPSRGALVPRVLRADGDAGIAVTRIAAAAAACNGFNLVGGEQSQAMFASSRAAPAALPAGISGVSNAGLDTPWPKLVRATSGVRAWVNARDPELDALFDVLNDRAAADDATLPDTGLPRERERLLSAPFIVSGEYGTRCSTVLAIERDGTTVHFIERTFNPLGEVTGDVAYRFRSEAA